MPHRPSPLRNTFFVPVQTQLRTMTPEEVARRDTYVHDSPPPLLLHDVEELLSDLELGWPSAPSWRPPTPRPYPPTDPLVRRDAFDTTVLRTLR